MLLYYNYMQCSVAISTVTVLLELTELTEVTVLSHSHSITVSVCKSQIDRGRRWGPLPMLYAVSLKLVTIACSLIASIAWSWRLPEAVAWQDCINFIISVS